MNLENDLGDGRRGFRRERGDPAGWGKLSISGATHQSLAVEQGRSAVAARRPFGEADHVIQLPPQRVDIVLLLLQTRLVVLCQTLKKDLALSLYSPETSFFPLIFLD